ncbi:hypothetical protein FXF51_51470 [Nonomuraea sp. PA05]|uniref:hypothetical protein n=1 Tax=Nonomuraea sp. PA05 TaxID=2604466 RepID=UPI0011D6E5B6|nr:hypothetical protein [Nonomuraea sp. PA05]TYB52359.1 hypothetical protein FXF51_51470 [Nonomuraea sp. PA05]
MSTATVRRRVSAALLCTIALSGLTVAAAPAQAAVSHVEFGLKTPLGTLVLTAREPVPHSKVGFTFDNDSSLAQWAFIREPDNSTGRYVLRHTENTGNPLCLDGLPGFVTLQPCNGRLEQLWTYSSSLGLKTSLTGQTAFLPAGDVLSPGTNLITSTQTTRLTRLFVP